MHAFDASWPRWLVWRIEKKFSVFDVCVKLRFLIICHLPQWDVSNFVTNRNLLCFRLESYSCKLVSHEKAFYKKFSRSVQAGMNEMEVLSPSKDDLATSPYGSIFTPFDIYNRFEKNQFSQTQLLNVVDIWSSFSYKRKNIHSRICICN